MSVINGNDAAGMRHQRGQSRWSGYIAGPALSLLVFILLDIMIGVFFLRDGEFLGQPVPPYGLTFTEYQAESLDWQPQPGKTGYGRFDPDLGWSISANGSSADGRYRANAAGFRAQRDYSLKRPAGLVRVAAFGDSFTHGTEVSNEETWVHILEQRGKNREVLNFGVSGYGTDQSFLRYRLEGARFQPDIVLIGYQLENILRNVSVYRPAYYHKSGGTGVKPRFMLDNSGSVILAPSPVRSIKERTDAIRSGGLLDTLEQTDYWVMRASLAYHRSAIFRSSLARITYGRFENSGRDIVPYYQDRTSEPFQVTTSIIKEFNDEARRMGAERVFVLLLPPRWTIARHLEGERNYWESLVVYLNEKDISFVDLTPALAEAARMDGLQSIFGESHYNRTGNEIVAQELDKFLFKQDET